MEHFDVQLSFVDGEKKPVVPDMVFVSVDGGEEFLIHGPRHFPTTYERRFTCSFNSSPFEGSCFIRGGAGGRYEFRAIHDDEESRGSVKAKEGDDCGVREARPVTLTFQRVSEKDP